jgi:hypothetical protein
LLSRQLNQAQALLAVCQASGIEAPMTSRRLAARLGAALGIRRQEFPVGPFHGEFY